MFTRRTSAATVFLASSLLLAGLMLSCLAGPASAAPGKGKKREPQKVSNAQLHEALQVLQATKTTLQGADHDYGGHRVEAIAAVGAAQRQLRLALGEKGRGKKPANSVKGVKGGNEAQAVSNVQLGDAIVVLERTHTFLQQANRDYGGHRDAAVRDVGVAVHHLKKALKFEKK